MNNKVIQRRGQMLVHSYIYYHMCDNIISDHKWQDWANDLVTLQDKYGIEHGFYDDVFFGWTGATGHHLPTNDYVSSKALQVHRYHEIHVRNNL